MKIVSGMLRPGSVLDGEVEASGQRNVSRSAYREAVRILVAKGLVHSKPKAGTRVNERSAWHLLDPDVLSWIFQVEPDYALVYSLFELRKMVEPEAAALAAERRTPRQLKIMADALKAMSHEKTVDKEWREADEQFHAALLEASGNFGPLSFIDLVKSACDQDRQIASYIGSNFSMASNHKLRQLPELLEQRPHVKRVSKKPLMFQWIPDTPTVPSSAEPNSNLGR